MMIGDMIGVTLARSSSYESSVRSTTLSLEKQSSMSVSLRVSGRENVGFCTELSVKKLEVVEFHVSSITKCSKDSLPMPSFLSPILHFSHFTTAIFPDFLDS